MKLSTAKFESYHELCRESYHELCLLPNEKEVSIYYSDKLDALMNVN